MGNITVHQNFTCYAEPKNMTCFSTLPDNFIGPANPNVIVVTNSTSRLAGPRNIVMGGVILSFTVSIAIGLIIGGMIWILITCLSRRRASAAISPRISSSSSRRPRTSSQNHMNRSGFYRNSTCERRSNLSLASLTFQRQTSQEQPDPFTRKNSFRASTFHPFLQTPPLAVEAESQLVTLPRANSTSPTTSPTGNFGRPDFHWSSNSLRLGNSTHTPPPAYESIIKAFPDP